mmetsp:Transcript_28705/g.66200  ORF Transcript_28705/g.66200 Transcript_28705/m.66200 type:complete len:220 (+) Transcript_28705:3775-4434(+)
MARGKERRSATTATWPPATVAPPPAQSSQGFSAPEAVLAVSTLARPGAAMGCAQPERVATTGTLSLATAALRVAVSRSGSRALAARRAPGTPVFRRAATASAPPTKPATMAPRVCTGALPRAHLKQTPSAQTTPLSPACVSSAATEGWRAPKCVTTARLQAARLAPRSAWATSAWAARPRRRPCARQAPTRPVRPHTPPAQPPASPSPGTSLQTTEQPC